MRFIGNLLAAILGGIIVWLLWPVVDLRYPLQGERRIL